MSGEYVLYASIALVAGIVKCAGSFSLTWADGTLYQD